MPHRLQPELVNGRTGDPVLLVDLPREGRAVLFDLGDISALEPRRLLRVTHAFVSHCHLDHFVGFDTLLRLHVGREKRMGLVGPAGFLERLGHRLRAYEWDLVDRIGAVLEFEATELHAGGAARRARFRLQARFEPEFLPNTTLPDGVVLQEAGLRVRAAVLTHHGPVLGYALEETASANVWRNRLEARGLPIGPWLAGLKRAVLEELPDDTPIPVFARLADSKGAPIQPLGVLREVVTVTPGRRIGWITDVADTPANRAAIADLVRGADPLFIEAPFAASEAAIAAERSHLTTAAAGAIARAAEARRVEPFHFSPRHTGQEARLEEEVARAFAGG